MTRAEILNLIELLPQDVPFLRHLPHFSGIASSQVERITRYSCSINDPKLGWKFVKTFVETKKRFPEVVANQDLWSAYWFETDDGYNWDILDALCLEQPQHFLARNFVQAFLLDKEKSLEDISEQLGIREPVLRAYANLFWNVRDRFNEPLYIGSLVYPEGRQVELIDKYLLQEDLRLLMLRAGYNHNIETVMYIGGLPTGFLSEFNAAETSQRLESSIMNNAVLLARLGGLNNYNPSINNARSIIAASKLSGKDEKPTDMLSDMSSQTMGESILDTLKISQHGDITKRLNIASVTD